MTGIVLSNASLDIVLHDNKNTKNSKVKSILPIINEPLGDSNKTLKQPRPLTPEQLKIFLVGLIDGDGSIQVNHWRRRILQYRIVIKLSHKPGNLEMLSLIKQNFGGTITLDSNRVNSPFICWAVNDQKTIKNVFLPIFAKYPFLTSRVRSQLAFMITSFDNSDMDLYFKNRENKYLINKTNLISELPEYWPIWLAGFIEAEGCFSYRKKGNYSFSIAQLNDYKLIELIRDYFKASHNKIRELKSVNGTVYEVSLGSLSSVNNVIELCYPVLQGYKYVQLGYFVLNTNNDKYMDLLWNDPN